MVVGNAWDTVCKCSFIYIQNPRWMVEMDRNITQYEGDICSYLAFNASYGQNPLNIGLNLRHKVRGGGEQNGKSRHISYMCV